MIEMIHAFVTGFSQVFSGTVFGLMLLGIGIGFIVGILPGLGGPSALALMLPFIVKMRPVEAFAFLLGMAAVTATTGDITSVLVGIPGEPTTAATIMDGYPMAKKGEAGRALGAALMSSLVGAIFGAFALALAVPVVRPLVLTFQSPEFFMLSVLGLTFVASLSGEVLLRGLVAGGIGLLLATIGVDLQSGIQRYTFGQLFLWDGIGLVPITIGFFAIPEIIDLAVQGTSISSGQIGELGGVMEGVRDTFRHWWLVIRCSAIGTVTAMLPGMGAATTQWIAYAHAVQSSPDRERFGKGAVEGVLGPGAANNSALGGSLVTTIAFGVPSGVMMAILLAAFVIQGLVPGPKMLIPEPKGHLALTFSFVWIIVFSNIITVGFCFLFLKQLARVTQIRSSLLISFILVLIYLGAFAEKNVFEDLLLVMIFGGLGWVMQRLNWPRPPLILGLVLGPFAENRLFLSTENYGLAWLARPGVLVIMALTIAGAFYPTLRARRERKRTLKVQEEISGSTMSTHETPLSRVSWSTAFDLAIVAMFAYALWESRRFNFRAGLFPWTIGFSFLALSIAQFVMDLVGKSNAHPPESGGRQANLRTAGAFGWVVGNFVAIWLLGFSIGCPLCTFIQLKIAAKEKWPITLLMTGFAWALIYGLFERILHVPFPAGKLLVWLNLIPV